MENQRKSSVLFKDISKVHYANEESVGVFERDNEPRLQKTSKKRESVISILSSMSIENFSSFYKIVFFAFLLIIIFIFGVMAASISNTFDLCDEVRSSFYDC